MFKLLFSRGHKREGAQEEHSNSAPLILFGLGNPGEKYKKTYHNAGHLYIEYLVASPFKNYKNFSFTKTDGLYLVKASTYMNHSGLAAKEALKHFKLKPGSLIVVHDDVDLPLGQYKLGFGQGSAGHRGVTSIIQTLKTKEFYRLRIGVRKDIPGAPRIKAENFVLKEINPADLKLLEETFSKIEPLKLISD